MTHPAVRTTVTATAVLGVSLLGLAPGPVIVGLVSDMTDLKTALTLAPLVSIVAAALFLSASRSYERDVASLHGEEVAATSAGDTGLAHA